MLRRLAVAAVLTTVFVSCAVPWAASAQSATPATLSGEVLSVEQAGTDFFSAACYQSLPNIFTESFSFAGTATGPYLGTFVETGTLTYALSPSSPGSPPEPSGPISNIVATFTITSPTGDVTGTAAFSGSAVAPTASCGQSAAAVWLQTDPIPTSYTATVTTSTGKFSDQGASTVTLSSGGPSGSAASSIDQSFTSSLPESTSPPKITGHATQGQTLVESHGAWTNSPTVYSYQWQRCDGSGSNCQVVAGATSQIYTLGIGDVGTTVRVLEWAANTGGIGGPAASAPTAVVIASAPTAPSSAPTTSPPPSASGGTVSGGPATPSLPQIKAQLLKQLVPLGKAATISVLLKKSGYTFSFKTLTAGRVVISWYYLPTSARTSKAKSNPVLVATGKASFSKAGGVRLTIKLTAQGKRMLKAATRLKLIMRGTYTPSGKSPVIATKSFTLRR